MDFAVRAATRADAPAIGRLVSEFQKYLRDLGDPADPRFGASAYLSDGFGESPAFAGLVAESSAGVVGYLLYHFGYDTDRAERLVFVIDLFVQSKSRQQGIGAALMREAAAAGRVHGAKTMIWSVYKPNSLARDFYEKLGAAKIDDLDFMQMTIGEHDVARPRQTEQT